MSRQNDTGNNAVLLDASISKLYDTFDPSSQGKMDWRAFLCLFVITVQPIASYLDHLRWSFAFYASYGDLDLEGPGTVPLGVVKAFMSYPVTIPLRERMRNLVHTAWEEIRLNTSLLTANLSVLKADPDDNPVSLSLFQKMLSSKAFRGYENQYRPYGKRGAVMLT